MIKLNNKRMEIALNTIYTFRERKLSGFTFGKHSVVTRIGRTFTQLIANSDNSIRIFLNGGK